VVKESATNTSGHHPVTISTTLETAPPSSRTKITTKRRVKWSQGDIAAYQVEIEDNFRNQELCSLPLEEAIEEINRTLLKAENAAIPSTKSKLINKPRRPMYPALAAAVAESKRAHYLWKTAGRPGSDHPTSISRKTASKQVRQVQRQHEAERRNQLYSDIIDSHEKDQSTFYRLLRRRHGSQSSDVALRLEGKLVYDGTTQCEAWADFYEKLATPGEDRHLGMDLDLIRWISEQEIPIEVDQNEVAQAIKNLNTGKAEDLHKIQAEHFKYGGRALLQATTQLINRIFQHCNIPTSTKTGYKLPIPKKGKDILELTNHRGITITPILGKIVEHILQNRPPLGRNISGLQYGFEKGKSPTMAILCLTEAIAHAKEVKQPLYVATLDAQKAFDVVDHGRLKSKLYYAGVRGHTWKMIDNLYTGCQEVVKWKGEYSRPYKVNQGVRQGGILSTTLYKEYVNPLLVDNEKSRIGTSIGSVYLGTPTCADDILLLSNSPVELQQMLTTAFEFSRENYYTIHPGKSSVTILVPPNVPRATDHWYLGEELITTTTTFTHLGLSWTQQKHSPAVEEKVTTGRKTAYMLIGRGINGSDGINPVISTKVAVTQVLPRMIHGLEATCLKTSEREAIDKAYKDLLRQYQNFPDRVATCAVYLLSATFPATVHMDYKAILLYGAVCRLHDENPLRQLAIRQLSLSSKCNSWFTQLRKTAQKYDIDLISQWKSPWEPQAWKRLVKEAVYGRCHVELLQDAAEKTSLKYLDLQMCNRGEPHTIWKSSIYSIGETKKASIRAKLLTGTYLLQANVFKFKRSQTPTCQLCHEADEDTIHFLVRCSALQDVRRPGIEAIIKKVEEYLGTAEISEIGLVRAILNGGLGGVLDTIEFNKLCNNLVYALHTSRTQQLDKELRHTKVVPSGTNIP
jgi:hypothetical protein